MGTAKHITIPSTGFPLDVEAVEFLQDAYNEAIEALARLAGHKTILYGVTVSENFTTVSDGYVCYNGEIMPFIGGAYFPNATIFEDTISVAYDADADNNGQQDVLQTYTTRYMKCGTGGVTLFPFGDLTRLTTIKELSEFSLPANIVIDPDYVHTDNNLTAALLAKLNGIEAGAQVNIQANWNGANVASGKILNKPENLMEYLKKGTLYIGDIQTGNQDFIVSFASVGTSAYNVIITLESSTESTANATATLSYVIHSKTSTSFKIYLREFTGSVQALRIRYIIT